MLIYFGFTYCPDVCPNSLTIMEDALDMLGDKAENITPIFITVDPERDDPEAMKTYVEYCFSQPDCEKLHLEKTPFLAGRQVSRLAVLITVKK